MCFLVPLLLLLQSPADKPVATRGEKDGKHHGHRNDCYGCTGVLVVSEAYGMIEMLVVDHTLHPKTYTHCDQDKERHELSYP